MSVWIALLRGVNIGGHHKIPMDRLRDLCTGAGCDDVRTYIQSGNVVFRSRARNEAAIAERIESAIEDAFAFRPAVILRNAGELRAIVEVNPFPNEAREEPSKLAVFFLRDLPADPNVDLHSFAVTGEQLRLLGRDLFVYFPTGMGKSKLQMPKVERVLRGANGNPNAGTARNWNSVRKLLAITEED